MGSSEQLVKIGAFARSARLTVRALHHYDEVGLLHPAQVDADTGYRYYDLRQLPTAATIAGLRRADIDIDTIRSVLRGSNDLGSLIEREIERHEQARRQAEAALAMLHHLDEDRDAPTIDERPPTRLLGRSVTVPSDDDATLIGHAFVELFERTDTPPTIDGHCVIRRSDHRQLYVDIGIAEDDVGKADDPGLDGIDLPAGTIARSRHRGPDAALTVTHAHLVAWCIERGHRIAGPACETYVGDLDDHTTIVWVPIEPAR